MSFFFVALPPPHVCFFSAYATVDPCPYMFFSAYATVDISQICGHPTKNKHRSQFLGVVTKVRCTSTSLTISLTSIWKSASTTLAAKKRGFTRPATDHTISNTCKAQRAFGWRTPSECMAVYARERIDLRWSIDSRTEKHPDNRTEFRITPHSMNRSPSPHTAATVDKNNNVRWDTTIFVTILLPKCIVLPVAPPPPTSRPCHVVSGRRPTHR